MKLPEAWQTEIAAGTERGKKRAAAWNALQAAKKAGMIVPSQRRRSPAPNGDLFSSRMQSHIEAATGTAITCGVCLAYLRSLDSNPQPDNHRVASQLAIDVQMSQEFVKRMGFRHQHQKKVQWFETLIEPLIPKPPIQSLAPSTERVRNPPMTFVYPYWHEGARGDELRFSIRSVMRHYGSKAGILVVGDRPPWYTGPMIHQARIRSCSRHAYCDMGAKMKTIANHPLVPDEAIWIMDDTYFMHPVDLENLKTPRAYKWDKTTNSDWRRIKKRTMEILARRKKPQHDYATHLPHHFEKAKLRALWDEYRGLDTDPLLWEVLYGNVYRGEPQSPVPFLRRLMAQEDVTVRNMLSSPVVNNGDQVWCEKLRRYLETRFPEPTEFELEIA